MYYNPFFYYMDSTYLLVLIGAILSIWASARVKATYSKYSHVRCASGMTGAEAAEKILRMSGIYDVGIEQVSGDLTDHYDSRRKMIRLSDRVYGSASVAAIGVAAHECGHAIQDQKDYLPLRVRTTLVPAANIGSRLGIPIILLGLIFSAFSGLITIGIWVFAISVLFQIVTLPVEFNASRRALAVLESGGILGTGELDNAGRVLRAAALTYVAAAAASILQLLRLILLFGGGRRRD
ncbi:MAG: zinc metallopeptidase [bacterium]|nr:zinc metallopeptidase [bacterium]